LDTGKISEPYLEMETPVDWSYFETRWPSTGYYWKNYFEGRGRLREDHSGNDIL